MPDTGAQGVLDGNARAAQQAALCKPAGKSNQRLMPKPRSTQEGRNGAQTVRHEVQLNAGLQHFSGKHCKEQFVAPCLRNRGVSGLESLLSLDYIDANVRFKNGEILFLGRGEVKTEPSSGSIRFHATSALSVRWLVSVLQISSVDAKPHGISLIIAAATTSVVSSSCPLSLNVLVRPCHLQQEVRPTAKRR